MMFRTHLSTFLILHILSTLKQGLALDLRGTRVITSQSSDAGRYAGASSAVDRKLKTISHTGWKDPSDRVNPWWKVDLGAVYCLRKITLVNRIRDVRVIARRLKGNVIRAGMSANHLLNREIGRVREEQAISGAVLDFTPDPYVNARYVSVDIPASGSNIIVQLTEFMVEEVSMDTVDTPSTALSLTGSQSDQSSTHEENGDSWDSARAVDGLSLYEGTSCSRTEFQQNPWWRMDLTSAQCIRKIAVRNMDDIFVYTRLNLYGAVVRAGLSATPTENAMCGSPVTLYQSLINDWIEFTCEPSRLARYVSVDAPGNLTLILCEVMIWPCDLPPTALNLTGKLANQSSTMSGRDARRAFDGLPEEPFCSITNYEENPWWRVDLESNNCLGKIRIRNTGSSAEPNLQDAMVQAGLSEVHTDNIMCGTPVTRSQAIINDWLEFTCDPPVLARYVSVAIPGGVSLKLCEVTVSTCDFQQAVNAVDITLVANPALLGETGDNSSSITAYRGAGDITNAVTFGRQLATGETSQELPSGSLVVADPSTGCAATLALRLPEEGGLNRTGVFYSEALNNNVITRIQIVILSKGNNIHLRPVQRTQTASTGDSVMLQMRNVNSPNTNYRWRHNGNDVIASWNNLLDVSVPNVIMANEGLYSCFASDHEDEQLDGIMRLIVRGCPSGLWDPPSCLKTCRQCYNGGVCHDKSGTCVCAPGFSGDSCEQVHGRHVFGKNGDQRCSDSGDRHHDACRGHLFCLPDPYGCSCAAGYTGLDCMQECDDGTFGADCKQTCHCASGGTCLKDTGECSSGCDTLYFGSNCQCSTQNSVLGLQVTSGDPHQLFVSWQPDPCASGYELVTRDECTGEILFQESLPETTYHFITGLESPFNCRLFIRPVYPDGMLGTLRVLLQESNTKQESCISWSLEDAVLQMDVAVEGSEDAGVFSAPGDLIFFTGQLIVLNTSLSGSTVSVDYRWYLASNEMVTHSPSITWSFSEAGKFTVSVIASDGISSSDAVSRVLNILDLENLPCHPSYVQIAGHRTNASFPLTYPRHVPLSFQGRTDVWCNLTTFRVGLQWTAFRVESRNETEMALSGTIATHLQEIHFPKGLLRYGLHVLQFSAVVTARGGYGYVIGQGSDRVWVRIEPSPPKAIILGGSARSVGYSSSLVLDGSGSFDPDNFQDPIRGLKYAWYCSKGSRQDLESQVVAPACFGNSYRLPFSDSSIRMPANTLAPDEVYTFALTVSLTGRGNSSTSQSITVVAQDPPVLSISCLQNCEEKLSVGERVVLQVTSPTSTVSYVWDVLTRDHVPDETFDWDRLTTTGRNSAYLVIVGGAFDDGDYRERAVRATGYHPDSPSPGFADYTFELNAPPRMGTCSLDPPSGYALQTQFIIDCVDFWDEEGHLMYTVRVPPALERKDEAALQFLDPVLYSGASSTTPSVYLPLGDASKGHLVTIAVEVADIHGASVMFTMTAEVRSPETVNLGDDENTGEILLNLTSGTDSELQGLIDQGDFQTAVQIIGAVGSILDSHDGSAGEGKGPDHIESQKSKELREEIRTSTVNTIATMPVESVVALQQSSYALVAITQDKMEVTQETQLTAATTLVKMGAFLKEHSVERTDCESCQTSIDDAALNLVSGLSNILDAAVASVDELTAVTTTPIDTVSRNDTISRNKTTPIEEDKDDVRAIQKEVKEKSKEVTKATLATISDVQDALIVDKVPGEEPTVIHSPALTLTSQRQEQGTLGRKSIGVTEAQPSGFILPDAAVIGSFMPANYTDAIDTQMVQFATDPFVWSEGSKDVTSEVVGLQLKTVDRQEIKVTDLPVDIQIFVPKRTVTLANNTEVTVNRSATVVISLQVTNPNATVSVLALPSDTSAELSCCLHYQGNESLVNLTEADCYINTTLPGEASKYWLLIHDADRVLKQRYTWMVDPEQLRGAGKYQALCSVQDSAGTSQSRAPVAEPDDTLKVLIGVYSSQCLFWNEEGEEWDGTGCRAGPLSSPEVTQCLCNHLTFFGSSFLVMPNKIDFLADTKLFLTFLDNPVVVTTVVVILALYVVVAVWARRQDKADALKACVITLEDNDPFAHYRYDVTIVTGMRRGAGTTAIVTLTLIGTRGKSRPHVLRDRQRQVLQRSGVDSFLLTTKQSLGEVKAVRIWHDNGGENPEWYVSRITVHDLETDDWWFFLCNSWLAVDIGEGHIDQTFPTATEKELSDFRHLFSTRTVRDLRDGHLWFSIFSRPARSTFTRLQRVSCCLSLLMCVMLTSIMFYGVPTDPAEQVMDFGAFRITFTEIIIGIESSVLAFPINLMIVTIFRYARPPEMRSKPYEIKNSHRPCSSETTSSLSPRTKEETSLPVSLTEKVVLNTDTTNSTDHWNSCSKDTSSDQVIFSTDRTSREPPTDTNGITGSQKWETSSGEMKFSQLTEPAQLISSANENESYSHNEYLHSCLDRLVDDLDLLPHERFLSAEQYLMARQEARDLVLTVMTIRTPSSSPTDRSETDSQSKTAFCKCSFKFLPNGLPHWFVYIGWFLVFSTTLVSSYFTMLYGLKYGKKRSIDWLVSLVVSLFQSVFFIQPLKVLLFAAFVALVMKQWDADDDGSDDIEEREIENAPEVYRKLLRKWKATHYRPPTNAEVNTGRRRKEMERKMFALLREIVGYFFFIWLVLIVAYSQRDRSSYYLTKHVRDVFFSSDEYHSISDFDGFFEWADLTLLRGLYQGDDQTLFLISGVRLRQLRVRPELCHINRSVRGIIDRCTLSYSKDTEDTGLYNNSWSAPLSHLSANGTSLRRQDIWTHQQNVAVGLWGRVASYPGGGYVANLGVNQTEARRSLKDLMAKRWLDEHSKVLVVEWTVYSANTNLFVVVTFLNEITASGGFVKTSHIQAVRLYRNTAQFQLFVLCIEILFSLYAAFYAFTEVRKIHQQRGSYWHDGWNWLEVAIVLTCMAVIAIYIYRHVSTERLLEVFRARPGEFVDFRAAAAVSEAFQYLLGLLLILCPVKFLHLLRLNPRAHLLTSVLSASAIDVGAFAGYIVLFMCAFALLFQLIFGRHLFTYSSIVLALESLFVLFLGEYRYEELFAVNGVTASILIIVFQAVATYLLLNVLIAVLNQNISYVRRHHEPSEDGKIGLLLIYKILSWFGIKHRHKF
ncbi:polycystic kidney disease protein 1-like 2 isoform X2 [Acanthaster planci]|uniref:Polycystic kidney disease protein 1-like 2 isoform X2 n=1 Tax=Acanthaster planci TaxID=133434 RepID=A0A8B7Z021_ACAPL|nr:polycystic kidney disease protein 1-like 2 isoform X2 [Acanthaster planci]